MKDENQKEEDVIPNFEIDDDNDDEHRLDSEYEHENGNEMTKRMKVYRHCRYLKM